MKGFLNNLIGVVYFIISIIVVAIVRVWIRAGIGRTGMIALMVIAALLVVSIIVILTSKSKSSDAETKSEDENISN